MSELYAFGNNTSGQLGLGNFESRSRPTKIDTSPSGFNTVSRIWCGGHNTFALFESGSGSGGNTSNDRGGARITLGKIKRLLASITSTSGSAPSQMQRSPAFRRVEMAVFAAFSSASVLNQSFLVQNPSRGGFVAQQQKEKASRYALCIACV